MLSIVDLAQITAAIVLTGGAFYWGGKMKAVLCALEQITRDHEDRIRELERGGRSPAK